MDATFDPDTISPEDRDYAIRTLIGEETNPTAQAGVASTILNRAAAARQSLKNVVLAPNQFEPWQRNPSSLLAIKPTDPAYVKAAEVFDAVRSGKVPDVTGGATHFYAPATQALLGRPPPRWGSGAPTLAAGSTLFYAPNGPVNRISPDQGLQKVDPFAEYQTEAPTAQPANGQPSAAVPSPVATQGVDPFKEYPTEAAPEVVAAATPVKPGLPPSQANAAVSGFFNGLPVVGPYAQSGLQKLTAWGQSQATGQPYGQALADIQRFGQASAAAYPKTALAGNVGGAIAGTVPMMMAAPGAFGLGSAPMWGRTLASGLSGGALGAADTAARGGSVQDIERGGALGAGFGALAPGAGQLIGNGIGWAANALTRTEPGVASIADTLRATGMSPLQAQAEIARLGPNATLADVSPALRAEAGSLAASGGAPTDTLTRFFGGRAQGADQRVNDVVTTALGPRPDLSAAEDGIRAAASAAAQPYYQAARAAPLQVDATPVVSYIDRELADAKGGVAKTLQMARNLVTKPQVGGLPGVTVPEDDAQRLLNARQALDDFIQKQGDQETSAGRNALRQASAVRSQIDQIVKMDPNIAAGDAAFSSKISEAQALQAGTTVFNPSMRLEDIQRSVASATPGQLDAMRQGALAAIHDKLGGVTGDYAAARNMFAKADINRAKLDALFPNSQRVLDAVESEIKQRGTEQAVTQNSLTAQRQAVAKKYALPETSPASAAPAIIGQALAGGPGAVALQGGKMSYDALVKSIMRARMNQVRSGAASALSTSGPAVNPLMEQLNRAYMNGPAVNSLSNGGSALANLLTRNASKSLPSWLAPAGNFPALPALSSTQGR